MNPLRVGIFGAGIVGGGVIDLVQKLNESGRFEMVCASIEIVKVCVKSLDKPRDVKVSEKTIIVSDYDQILSDSSINCIVEVMGGVTDAKDVVFAAIKNGKHVITANKALVAAFLPEIQKLLLEHPTVKFCFEAAVCGGIPIIHTLHSAYLGDSVTKMVGIMNGTTNFMLCKMEDEGVDYGDALKEAQRLGFAEADPTADVEGLDVQAKIALLVKLAFGATVPLEVIPTAGISKVTSADFAYARSMNSTIKLLGTAGVNTDGSLAVFVAPTIVSLSSPLSTAKGPGNMVVINSENMGSSTFAGPGAGRFPTANSILSDLVRLSQGATSEPFPLSSDIVLNNNYQSKFYVRIKCRNAIGIIGGVGEAAERHGVSIFSVLQNPNLDPQAAVNFVVTTDNTTFSQVQSFAKSVAELRSVLEAPMCMPIL